LKYKRPPLPLLLRRGIVFISPPFKEEIKRRSKKTNRSEWDGFLMQKKKRVVTKDTVRNLTTNSSTFQSKKQEL